MRLSIPFACLLAVVRAAAGEQASGPDAAATALMERLNKAQFAEAHRDFDSILSGVLGADGLAALWKGLLFQNGPYRSCQVARSAAQGPATVVYLSCRFERAMQDVVVTVNRDGKIGGLWFAPARQIESAFPPPPYADRNRFAESQATVGEGPLALPGTLALPKGAGPFPGLVLVHGSGPNDRDETIGPNKPFRDIAQGLASRGIAVLRYEKRTRIQAPDAQKITVQVETIDDAVAAARTLAGMKQIDRGRIFILGHSLGGMLIPRIAQRFEPGRGLIIMAGTARPLEDVIVEQVAYLASLQPDSADVKKQLESLKAQAARIKALDARTDPKQELLLGVGPRYWLDLRDYDPPAAAKRIKAPMLILQGGRDYQVTMTDMDRWKEALGRRADVQFKLYPRGNHLLMNFDGPCTPAEYEKPGHVPEAVILDLRAWIEAAK